MKRGLRPKIKATIKKSIEEFFRRKLRQRRTVTHVLDRLFPRERRVRTLIGGLETSMGTTVWEPVAELLAKNNGFQVSKEQILKPKNMPRALGRKLEKLTERREEKGTRLSLKDCKDELRATARLYFKAKQQFVAAPAGRGVDLYLKKRGRAIAIDIKTNQVNKRGGLELNRQLLQWYAYKFCADPDAKFRAAVAFPFNPFGKDWWEAIGGRIHPLKPGEALVESDFWDLCSGSTGTWEVILQCFDELRDEGFAEQFRKVFHPRAKSSQKRKDSRRRRSRKRK